MSNLHRPHTIVWILLLSASFALAAPKPKVAAKPAAVPTPESVFGFEPGADYHLADYEQISDYFQKLAAASPRVKLEEIGESGYGKKMFVAI